MEASEHHASRSSLPLELLELCLDAFALDHDLTRDATFYQTLLSCALTSHSLLPRSRHHIYSSIRLTFPPRFFPPSTTQQNKAEGQRRTLKQFAHALTLNPSLTGYVRTLELEIDITPLDLKPVIIFILEIFELHLRSRSFSHLGERSPSQCTSGMGLRELALSGGAVTFVWSALDEDIREGISRLINADSDPGLGISSLRLSCLSAVPVNLISTIQTPLESLSLQKVWFTGSEDGASRGIHLVEGILADLKNLKSYDCGARLESALCNDSRLNIATNPPIFSRLKTLQVWATQRQDVEWGAAAVTSNAESLQTLDVGGFSQGQAQYASMLCSRVNLCSLPRLTTLVITVNSVSTPHTPMCPFALLDTFEFNRPTSSSETLKSLQINMRCLFHKYPLFSLDEIFESASALAVHPDGSMTGETGVGGIARSANPTQVSDPPRWTPTFADHSIRSRFPLLSHVHLNVMLRLGTPFKGLKGEQLQERIRAQMAEYLAPSLTLLKTLGILASITADTTPILTA